MPIQQIGDLSFDRSTVNALKGMASNMADLSAGVEDRLDEAAIAQETKLGTSAGHAGIPVIRQDNTLRAKAFNKAAVESYGSRMETDIMAKMNELSAQHSRDPQGFQKEYTSYMRGVVKEVEGVSPELAMKFAQGSLSKAQAMSSKIQDNYNDDQRDMIKASVNNYQDQFRRGLSFETYPLFSTDPEESTNALNRIINGVAEMGRQYNRTDTNGQRLFTREQAAKFQQKELDYSLAEVLKEQMRVMDFKLSAIQKMESDGYPVQVMGTDGKDVTKNLKDYMSPESWQKVIDYARSNRRNINTIAEKARKEESERAKRRQGATYIDEAVKIMTKKALGQKMTPKDYLGVKDLVDNEKVGSTQGDKLLSLIGDDFSQKDDEEALRELSTIFVDDEGDLMGALSRLQTKLTPQTVVQYAKLAKASSGKKYDPIAENYKMLFRELTPSTIEKVNPSGEAKRSSAMREYMSRVQQGEDPAEAATNISERVRPTISFRSMQKWSGNMIVPQDSIMMPKAKAGRYSGFEGLIDTDATAKVLIDKYEKTDKVELRKRLLYLRKYKKLQEEALRAYDASNQGGK